MQINLKQQEIEKAITLYLAQVGIQTSGKNVDMLFVNGRKTNGINVTVNITNTSDKTSPPQEAVPTETQPTNEAEVVVSGGSEQSPEPAPEPEPVKTSSLFN